jgi:hypothetical protein
MTVTPRLNSWTRYEKDVWPTLLLGNGASANLWDGFSYKSLFGNAFFTPPAEDLFTELNTTNFEQVLECIHHAKLTEDALGTNSKLTVRLYNEVRDALFEEVTDSHIEWTDMTIRHFQSTADAVRAHSRVFTTNYDLTLYWSMLQGAKRSQWADQFWNTGAVFDRHNIAADNDPRTLIYYLHGAVHLWRNRAGVCGKWTSDQANLLSVLNNYNANSDRQPMFVSEGTSKRKLASIRRSEYLTSCLTKLEDDDTNTVVFGHSLGREDQHVLQALNLGPKRRIAVGMYPKRTETQVQEDKARIINALNRQRVVFFDSTTHPLGDPTLHIPAP